MRISDWSSDVCSSDLPDRQARAGGAPGLHDLGIGPRTGGHPLHEIENQRFVRCGHDDSSGRSRRGKLSTEDALAAHPPFDSGRSFRCGRGSSILAAATSPARSEAHTSELQSLMRISYAVFCLKKKKKHKI